MCVSILHNVMAIQSTFLSCLFVLFIYYLAVFENLSF